MGKFFQKTYDNHHVVFKFLGVKFKFLDLNAKLSNIEAGINRLEKIFNDNNATAKASRIAEIPAKSAGVPVVKRLEKYLYVIDEFAKYDYLTGEMNPNVKESSIWTLWLQGDQPKDMPEIVDICISRTRRLYPDNFVLLTEKTINDYITLPDFIWQKYREGKISPAHFSDIVRVCLLDKYGGTWVDSTCYLMDVIPEAILNQDVHFLVSSMNVAEFSNWFISSKSNNLIIKSIKTFLFEYWKENNEAWDYFIFHCFVKMAKEKHKKFKQHWREMMPIVVREAAFCMPRIFINNSSFDKDWFNKLRGASFICKLSYKLGKATNSAFTDENMARFCKYLKSVE